MLDTLETIEWGEKHFGSLHTNRVCRRRDVMPLVECGFARSIGMTAVCDDDGSRLDPERFREGFVLTETGRRVLHTIREAYRLCAPLPERREP